MTATKALGTYGNAVGVVTPADHKAAQSGLIAKTALNAVRPGLFWGGNASVIVGKANMSYDVIAFTAALSRGATSGTVLLSNDGTLNVATTAAPGSNSRIDIIYVWAREYSLDGVDSNPVIGVVQGTAAASPTAPSLASFPGAIEIGRATVGAGITATTSATITQTAPFTAMDGGRIPFRNTTERDAGTYVEGQLGWLIDTNILQVYSGSSWADVSQDTTAWAALTLSASWVNFGGAYATAQYRRVGGIVYLSGLIKSGTTTPGTVIATLPAGFRPAYQDQYGSYGNSALAAWQVNTDGTIRVEVASATSSSLAGIRFPAA